MTRAASPTQSRHAMARQDVAADALVVAEVGTRKEYRAPLWQGSVPKRVLVVGPCEFSQISSSRKDAWSTQDQHPDASCTPRPRRAMSSLRSCYRPDAAHRGKPRPRWCDRCRGRIRHLRGMGSRGPDVLPQESQDEERGNGMSSADLRQRRQDWPHPAVRELGDNVLVPAKGVSRRVASRRASRTKRPRFKPFGGGCQPPDRLLAEVKPLDGGYGADFGAHNHHRQARRSLGARKARHNHQHQA